MKRLLSILILLFVGSLSLCADRYTDYIATYAPLAIEQQQTSGIPASITLAQGLLESGAGTSRLATEGNNHFGIKCHNTWTGATMLRDDDAPDECFRVYDTPAQSYADHSRFLHSRRYAPLFELAPDDYHAWAQGLRQCGYATDPNYAERLISIIDRYALYQYDGGDGAPSDPGAAEFIMMELSRMHAVRVVRGLHYVIAAPGDTYASIAAEFSLPPERLATLNDATDPNTRIKDWEEVYFQPKHDRAAKGQKNATIGEGETLHSVAQRYALTLASLLRANPKITPTAPTGTHLRLP